MTENTKFTLAFGRLTYPESVRAAWGARLIYPADLVWDRQDVQSHDDEAKDALIAWLNGTPSGTGAIAAMRDCLSSTSWCVANGVSGKMDFEKEVVIYEDNTGKIVGSSQNSHGYFYVCGWLKAHVQ